MSSSAPNHEDLPPRATHYQVLGLTPALLSSATDPLALLKRAYRRALLQNHPDKSTVVSPPAAAAAASQPPLSPTVLSPPRTSVYTIDQISHALAVLSSPSQRAAYDASLTSSLTNHSATAFQTGVENVDLDDLPFDSHSSHWYRSCRCGNDRGYLFDETDLVPVADEGLVMVACQDCSLWLRVHFALVQDSASSRASSQPAQSPGQEPRHDKLKSSPSPLPSSPIS